MLIAVLLPSLCAPRETANRVKCASNLRQIGLAITNYAKSHGGEYPPSLAVLVGQEISPEVLTCPSSNDVAASGTNTDEAIAELTAAESNAPGHKDCLSYVYVGRGLNANTATDRTIVAYEPLDNHDGDGTNVLFGDGHIEFEGKQMWPKIAADAGVKVVKSLATKG
jgi:prepilin-type processing-associated H-X9-DG protein